MTRIYNPKKKRYEEVDPYVFFDAMGFFPTDDKTGLKRKPNKTYKSRI
jgi:hypothetical protein